MENTDLFLSLAEIAGVFVGFGALIAARSGVTISTSEISGIRWVLMEGIWVVIVAIAPAIIAGYGVAGHELWLVCGLLAVVIHAVMLVVYGRAPESRADRAETFAAGSLARDLLWMVPTFWLPTAGLVLALALVVFGIAPDQDRALYLTAVGLGLYMSATGLFAVVFWNAVGSPAPGGASSGAAGSASV